MRKLVRVLVFLAGLLVLLVLVATGVGMTMSESHEATRSVRVSAPITAIYDLILTPENYPQWRTDVERVERLDSDRFREYGANGPMLLRIIERTPPSRVVVAVDDPDQPFSGAWTIELQQEGGQGEWTRVRITERGKVPNPLFRAIARAMQLPTESIEVYLKHLGRRFNQDVTIEP